MYSNVIGRVPDYMPPASEIWGRQGQMTNHPTVPPTLFFSLLHHHHLTHPHSPYNTALYPHSLHIHVCRGERLLLSTTYSFGLRPAYAKDYNNVRFRLETGRIAPTRRPMHQWRAITARTHSFSILLLAG